MPGEKWIPRYGWCALDLVGARRKRHETPAAGAMKRSKRKSKKTAENTVRYTNSLVDAPAIA